MPFLLGLLLALPLVPAARSVGLAIGLVDHPRGDPLRVHPQPVPFLGGVAVITATIGAVFASSGRMAPATLAAVVLALVVGSVDDRWSVPPLLRLLALLAAGAVVVLGGEAMWLPGPWSAVLTVLVVASCANAVNMTDGQDGLAGGLAAFAAIALSLIAGREGMPLGLALAGALSVFLLWNRPPARIFLGNGGA
jgi:UDP-GlcNAc:undecaprenyl-phosphate GlcNAc-1-phosphate transferase